MLHLDVNALCLSWGTKVQMMVLAQVHVTPLSNMERLYQEVSKVSPTNRLL